MRDRSDGQRAQRGGVGTLALILALCAGLWIEPAPAQEPSIGDRVGDFFKRLVPGGGGDQAQPQQPPATTPRLGSSLPQDKRRPHNRRKANPRKDKHHRARGRAPPARRQPPSRNRNRLCAGPTLH